MVDVDESLSHHGVKGMKWGVRKDTSRGKIRRGITKANVALDSGRDEIQKNEAKLIFLPKKNRNEAANNTQLRMLGEARKLNKNPKFKGKDLKRNPQLKADYKNELDKKAITIYKEELSDARLKATSEVVRSIIDPNYNNVEYSIPRNRVRHDDSDDYLTILKLDFNKDNLDQVVDVNINKSFLEHDDKVNEFLAHHGVKGMKWGVRKDVSASNVVRATQRRPGTKLVVTGGKGVPAHQDAVKTAETRQIARKSNINSVSNKDLQEAVRRMQLEQQFNQLSSKPSFVKRGTKFVKELLGVGRTANEVVAFSNSPAGKELKNKLNK